ncbi:hypothetical protein OAI29_08705 [Amylibacter sp.]|nr:hypothetical protein [Amylibacter sp.]
MGDVVKRERADFGVAFDGDFDRRYFFDASGEFMLGEYVVGLLASIFLDKEVGAKIVHDPRVVWFTQDIVSEKPGVAVQSKMCTLLLSKRCGHMKRSTVVRCQRTIIFAILHTAIVG